MKNKVTFKFIALIGLLVILGACSSSNEVVSNNIFTKRKVNRGYHINWPSHWRNGNEEVAQEVVSEQEKIAVVEQVANRETKTLTSDAPIEEHQTVAGNYVEEQTSLMIQEEKSNSKTTNNSKASSLEDKQVTGKKEMHQAKKLLKKTAKSSNSDPSLSIVLLYIIAFFIPFLAVGIVTDWDLFQVLINIILCLLCWVPGIIHAIIVVHKNAR